jgi:hypothetical protein
MSDGSVKVPVVTVTGKEVDCEIVPRVGIDYYRQRTNSHNHYQDVASGVFAPCYGDSGFPYVMDYHQAISRGKVTGASIFTTNGHIVTVGATNQAVSSLGVANVPTSAGVQMSFVGGAQDTPTGTGIRTISMGYIEAVTLLQKTEVIALNGTTPVLSVAANVAFINTLTKLTGGTNKVASGEIIASSGGVNYAAINAGEKVQESSFRMVPAAKIFVPNTIVASSVALTADTFSVLRIVGWNGSDWIPSNPVGIESGSIVIPLIAPRIFTAGALFGIEHTTNKAADVTASMLGHLENA